MMPRTRIRLAVMVCLFMVRATPHAQHLSSARSIGLGASVVFTDDLHAIDWNPAILPFMKNWEASVSGGYIPTGEVSGTLFHSAGLAKQFGAGQSAVARLSPGIIQEFIVPSIFSIEDSSHTYSTKYDKKISYRESFAAGYGWRISSPLSVGLSVHLLEEKVNDTKYTIDSNFLISTTPVDYTGSSLVGDAGVLWSFNASWKAAAVGKNVFRLKEHSLPQDLEEYELNADPFFRAGVGFAGVRGLLLGLDADFGRQVRIGGEWLATPDLRVRTGSYIQTSPSVTGEALSFGIGMVLPPVKIDVSYLAFLSQTNRRGVADINEFLESGISNIEYNKFTGDRLSVSATINFGAPRRGDARIEYVDLSSDIFPAAQSLYAFQPLGKARVKNISSKSIDAKVSFYLDDFMDAPTETRPYPIAPGETVEIPLFAVLNEHTRTTQSRAVREGDVYVRTFSPGEYDDHYQLRVLVHGRNDWNGEISQLPYFVTPEDPAVVTFARTRLAVYKSVFDTIPQELHSLKKAEILFGEFAGELLYVDDPKSSQDYVQYASETLGRKGGDCDDLSVCLAALLSSIGISTAFVDVVPPDRPDQSHVYLLFDSGVEAQRAEIISRNPKRYVVRKNDKGNETAWIPIETTVVQHGFEEAWSGGAKEYFTDAEVNLGLVKGWMTVVDVGLTN